MKISTRGRYALRVMIDLAEHNNEEYIPLKEISQRQDISQKYLESIMVLLSRNSLVDAVHGKGGGYKLNRPLSKYTLKDILTTTEGDIAPVSCLEGDSAPCERAASCKTLPVWTKLEAMLNSFFNSVTLEDLITEAKQQ